MNRNYICSLVLTVLFITLSFNLGQAQESRGKGAPDIPSDQDWTKSYDDPVTLAKEVMARTRGFWTPMGYATTVAVYTVGAKVAMYGGGYILLESPNLAVDLVTGGFYKVGSSVGYDFLMYVIESSVKTPQKVCQGISETTIQEGLRDYAAAYKIAKRYKQTKDLSREEALEFLDKRWGLLKLGAARTLYNESRSKDYSLEGEVAEKTARELMGRFEEGYQKDLGLDKKLPLLKAAFFIKDLKGILEAKKVGLMNYPPYLDFIRNIEALNRIRLDEAKRFTNPPSLVNTWIRTYGGVGRDEAESVQQTTDGGYILVGTTESFGVESREDVYLIKTNPSGDTLWTRTYGGGGNDDGHSVQQTKDGGYIITGFTGSGCKCCNVYLIKTNSLGDTLWTRKYCGKGYAQGSSVQQTSDGGYVVVGYTRSCNAGGSGYVYLIKTNPSGDTIWTRTYGGEGYDKGFSVQQTIDGGYIVAGETESFGGGLKNVYLIKTNIFGDTLWTRTYGGRRGYSWGKSVRQTSEGGYIVAGSTDSFGAGGYDLFLIKTNPSGDTLWTKTYGGKNNDQANSVLEASSGGYIIVGWTESFRPVPPTNLSQGYSGRHESSWTDSLDPVTKYTVPYAFIIQTDVSGTPLRGRCYGEYNFDSHGPRGNWATSVQETSDGGYIIAGETSTFGAGSLDFYLIKMDANGNVGVK